MRRADKNYLDRVVRGNLEKRLNALLEAENDRLCNERYKRSKRVATPAPPITS
jgi:hypothetical protein